MVNWRSSGTAAGEEYILQQLDSLHSYASALGHAIKPGSRIDIFERNFRRFMQPGHDPRRDLYFNPLILAHGNRDLFELNFICEKLTDSHTCQLKKAMPDLLSGAALPGDDRNHTSRNLQFQYFLAAQLAHSGFTISLEEPDAVFVHEQRNLGIAAKRPISRRQLVGRVKEGVKQLKKSCNAGFIAISLDRLLKLPDPYLVAGGEQALDAAAHENLRNTLAQYAEPIKSDLANTMASGIIFSLTLIGCVRVPWQPAHTTAMFWLARTDDLPFESELVKSVVNSLKGPTEM
jgi:hypothetical protein